MVENYEKEIKKLGDLLVMARKSKTAFTNEKQIYELEQSRYLCLYSQIHGLLAPEKTKNSEDNIQELVKSVIIIDLPICESKLSYFSTLLAQLSKKKNIDEKQLDICYQYCQSWSGLYEKYFALAGYRSLEHFARFMEWDTPDHNKVWKYSLDPYNDGGKTGVNKPFFFYFNRMVLKKDIKFISKQMFTGAGKSFSNQVAIAWLFGVDKDNDVLDVLGNPALVLTNAKSVSDMMIKPRYAQVFPDFQKYHDMGGDVRANMFTICRLKDGELTIEGSTKPLNLKVISKQTSIDGIRVRFLFLDDVCRSKDANNLTMHTQDIDNFWNSWYKRNYGTDDFYIVVGGTAYSVEDILSHLIRYFSNGKLIRSAENKYTYRNEKGDCVIIKIPKIDDDYNRSTYPQKFPYADAVRARDRNPKMFMAMEQQQPQNPETTPLAWDKIRTYTEIPSGLSDYAQAVLDPARTGANYVSMPIHKVRKEIDKFGEQVECHYLVDVLYELKKMEDLYGKICDLIEKHHIVRLFVENNTDTSLAGLLEKMLHERNVTYCKIIPFYTYQNKEQKMREVVYANENTLLTQFVFPAFELYAPSHPMSKFMQNITCYDYKEKMEYDDGIDSECMYVEKFIEKNNFSSKASAIHL